MSNDSPLDKGLEVEGILMKHIHAGKSIDKDVLISSYGFSPRNIELIFQVLVNARICPSM